MCIRDRARITGYGTFAPRAERIAVIRAFLARSGFGEAGRQYVQGDASTRAYERLTLDGASYILMNSPKRPDGPPVHDGKPYSAIAHLAENVTPFVAMAQALRARELSAPGIFAADRAAGLLVIEDLGNELVVAGDPPAPIEARYEVAADLLAALHRAPLPDVLPVEPGVDYRLPRYDLEALLIEAELLVDWYLPRLDRQHIGQRRAMQRRQQIGRHFVARLDRSRRIASHHQFIAEILDHQQSGRAVGGKDSRRGKLARAQRLRHGDERRHVFGEMRDRAIGLAVVHRRSVRPLRRIHQDIARAIESEPLVSARGGVALSLIHISEPTR